MDVRDCQSSPHRTTSEIQLQNFTVRVILQPLRTSGGWQRASISGILLCFKYSRINHSVQKTNPLADEERSTSIPEDDDSHQASTAIVTYTNYARGTLYPHNFRLISQHVILSQQTLGDIWDNLPCDHKVLPIKSPTSSDSPTVRRYHIPESPLNGAAICVEDIVYGDGLSKPDYAEWVFIFP